MKIMNLLKKVTAVTDEKDAHITNNQNSDRVPLQKAEHENSNISPDQPIIGIDNRWKSDNSTQFANRHTITWPNTNETVKELMVSQQIRVFLDASFIKSQAFSKFAEVWHANRISTFATKFFFVPAFEKMKLTEEELLFLDLDDYRERPGNDFKSCFAKMVEQNLRWNIVLLTENSEIGSVAQIAAQENGLQLRYYSMNSFGRLCTINRMQYQVLPTSTDGLSTQGKIFKPTTELVKIRRINNVVNAVPRCGNTVETDRNGTVLYLKQALMTDHVSITYATSDEKYYAKVYTANSLQLDIWENKARRMLEEIVNIPGVCWPVDTLKDRMGRFIGILIPASKGIQLTRSVLNGASGLSQYFSQWNKQDLCTLTITILSMISKMHELGLFFGCLNPASIYVENAESVYFVDTDEWQIEGFPAISRNQTFTPPELLQGNTNQLLYTLDQEYYQVALLTFMLMMPGKFPYAKGQDADERNSIITMSFPFSVGGGMRRSADAERPSGIWRIVWDHLPYKLCDCFYNTFHFNGRYARPGQRLSDANWLALVKDFSRSLISPERVDSCSLFPRTFRRDGKRVFAQCTICGQQHPDFYFIHNIRIQKELIDIWGRGYRVCLPCANDQSNKSFICKCCGREYFYTNRSKIFHEIGKSDFDFKTQQWCRDCKKRTTRCNRCGNEVPIYQVKEFEDKIRNQRKNVCGNCFKELIDMAKRERDAWKKETNRMISCRNCGCRFAITNGEVEYFSKKGLNLPTRCPTCRNRHY